MFQEEAMGVAWSAMNAMFNNDNDVGRSPTIDDDN